MEFMSKSERICEHGRLLVFWKYVYPHCGGELEAALGKAAEEFCVSCRELKRLAESSGETVRAYFGGQETTEIEVTVGNRAVICEKFSLG